MGARLIVVTGGKGGPGATTLAVGLAGALAADGRGVLLADLDPAGGDVAAHLPAEPHRGLLPLLSLTGGSVGAEEVAAESVAVGEHLWVLPGLPRPDTANGGLLSAAGARAVVLAACQLPEVEVAVVDAGRLLPGSVGASLLEVAELGVLAVRPDYLGALAARRVMDAAPRARRLVPGAAGSRLHPAGSQLAHHAVHGRCPVERRPPRSVRGDRWERERPLPTVPGRREVGPVSTWPDGTDGAGEVPLDGEPLAAVDAGLVAQLRAAVAGELSQVLGPERLLAPSADDEARVWASIARHLGEVNRERVLAGTGALDADAQQQVGQAVFDALLRLGPLERYLAQDDVEELMVNGHRRAFVVRAGGVKQEIPSGFASEQELRAFASRTVAAAGRRLDEATPAADTRLPDGSRLHVICPPLAPSTCVTIRRHRLPAHSV